jgi:hypothetical protein
MTQASPRSDALSKVCTIRFRAVGWVRAYRHPGRQHAACRPLRPEASEIGGDDLVQHVGADLHGAARVSCAAMRNGVIFRLITTSPTNNHGGFAADELRSPRRPVEKGATTRRFDYRDRLACTARDSRTGTRFASAPAARTTSMVAYNDQVKGGRVPGFPHPVEPAGGTRRHGWGYREPRSSADTRRRCRPQFVSGAEDPAFDHNQLATSPLDTSSPFARRHHRCRLSMVNLSQGEPCTPLLRGEPRIRCIPVSVQLTEC